MKLKFLFLSCCFFSVAVFAQFKSPNYISNAHQFKLANNVTDKDYLPKTIVLKVNSLYTAFCTQDAIQNSALISYLQSIGATDLKKNFRITKRQ